MLKCKKLDFKTEYGGGCMIWFKEEVHQVIEKLETDSRVSVNHRLENESKNTVRMSLNKAKKKV